MSNPNPNRQPPGVPTGGQFAPSSHPESEVELSTGPDTIFQTANGYLLCVRHAEEWRSGGNNVAMWPAGAHELAEGGYLCIDCANDLMERTDDVDAPRDEPVADGDESATPGPELVELVSRTGESLQSWSGETVEEIGSKLTCDEMEELAGLFTSVGREDLTIALTEAHAAADEPEDRHFRG